MRNVLVCEHDYVDAEGTYITRMSPGCRTAKSYRIIHHKFFEHLKTLLGIRRTLVHYLWGIPAKFCPKKPLEEIIYDIFCLN